jgi:PAS domain S-box-containing protein
MEKNIKDKMKKKVLIVDDNSANLYVLKSLLESEGIEVIEAQNGQVALTKAKTHTPGVIISDILMPVMDGYTFCRHCKSDEKLKNVPFIFYTATYTESKDEKFALSLGADRFLVKPQEPEILMGILSEYLSGKKSAKTVLAKPLGEEMEFFRAHNEILFSKLEKKMSDLETANKQLMMLEERYRLSFENASDVIFIVDENLNILSISQSAEKILGYKPEEFIGKPVAEMKHIFSPSYFEKAMTDAMLILKGETISVSIYEFMAKDGTIKYGEVSGSPIIQKGQLKGFVSIARDITDRRRMEDELRQSEERYRILIDNADEAICVVQDGMLQYVNHATAAITGYPAEILTSRPFTDFIDPQDQKFVYENYQKRIKGKESPLRYTFRVKTKTGLIRWVENHVALITWEGKHATLNFINDITEQKDIEDALRESEEKYIALFEFSQDAILLTKPDGSILDANKAACDMFGRTVDEIRAVGRNGLVDVNDPRLRDALIERNKLGRARAEIIMVRANGEKFSADITSTVFVDKRGDQNTSMIIRDITERKKVEDALVESEEKYRTILEDMNDMYYELDLKGDMVFFNKALLELTGRDNEELRKMNFKDYMSPESAEYAFKIFGEIFKTGKSTLFVNEIFTKNGEIKYFESRAGLLLDENKKPIGFRGLARDITDRKKAQDERDHVLKRLRKTLGTMIQAMAAAVETRDPYTSGHQRRVSDLARSIAAQMKLPSDQIDGIRMAASIHDLGKISIPAEILSMPRKLSELEFELVKTHPQAGYDIIKDIDFPWPIANIILQHHERIDGSGYPNGLNGKKILLEARILAVADVVEAMASYRPYRPALGLEKALEEIIKNRSVLYDPEAVDACLKLFKEKGYKFI